MGNDDHRRGSKDDKGKDRRNSKDEGKGHDRRRSSAKDERRHSEDHNRKQSSDRRHSEDHNRKQSSDRRHSEDQNRRRSSDRRNSDDQKRRRSSDRRRSSARRYSNAEDEKDVEYFGEHNDFFRRLSAIVAYDAEYRRDPQNERRKSDANDNDYERKKSDAYDGNRKRGSEDRRDSQKSRRYSGESDRRNSRNDDEHRPSLPRELLEFQKKFQKTQPNGPDHSHFHQRWMFLWPFGKKGKTDDDETAENPETVATTNTGNNERRMSNKQEPNQQQNQDRRKSFSEGVQTIDGSLVGPSSTIQKLMPKMITDTIQTSFPNFGLQPTIIRQAKDGSNPVSLRDGAVQTLETKMKQTTHVIQTSFVNLIDNKKKVAMKDSTTSMHFKRGHLEIPPDNKVRTVKAVPRDVNKGTRKAAQNEQPTDVEHKESPTSSIPEEPRPRQIKQLPSNLCPICKRGYYTRQVSLSGCLAAFFCLLCCGPCWCRKCCDITVCDYCGCSKSFYKREKDAK